MTHIVEHKSFRYTWELVRHTYLVDSESDIEIRQVEISPSHENRLLDPPYPLTPFFEIEIDQIQKNGKTVFSLRNICPVQIDRKPDSNFLNSLVKIGSPRLIRRFQSQDGETETRWLYTDDFFLISLSSGDRHDLSMLLSLIFGKLNMIAVSIQSGKRIPSELENQQTYRAAMSSMFSDGVDGAFRDVPVYQQYGDITGSGPDERAAIMSTALREFPAGDIPVEDAEAPCIPAVPVVAAHAPEEFIEAEMSHAESTMTQSTLAAPAGEESNPFANIVIKSTFPEAVFGEHAATTGGGPATEPVPGAGTAAEGVQAEGIPEQSALVKDIPATMSCRSCGAGISSTTKFCGSCGAAVSTPLPAERAPVLSGMTTNAGDNSSSTRSRSTAGPVVNLNSIEELDDLSWLTD